MTHTDRSELAVHVAGLVVDPGPAGATRWRADFEWESVSNAPLYRLRDVDAGGQAIDWGPVLGLALILAPWFLIAWLIWMWA